MSETLLTEGHGEPAAPMGGGTPPAEVAETPTTPTTPPPAPTEGRIFLHNFANEEWAKDPAITRFADEEGGVDVGTLVKSYQHAQSLVGKDKIVLPQSEDLASDDWQETFTRLGRPDSPDKYEFERPELPEGVDAVYSEDTENHFREIAHGLGLNQRQAQEAYKALIAQRLEEIGQYTKDTTQAREEGIAAIRREQGDNFDAYMNSAKAAIREFADPDYIQYLEQSGQGNDPRVIRMWAKVGKELRGETRLEGNPSAPTPGDVQAEIDAYIDKHGRAVDDVDHPDYSRHRQHLNRLYEKLYGNDIAVEAV